MFKQAYVDFEFWKGQMSNQVRPACKKCQRDIYHEYEYSVDIQLGLDPGAL